MLQSFKDKPKNKRNCQTEHKENRKTLTEETKNPACSSHKIQDATEQKLLKL